MSNQKIQVIKEYDAYSSGVPTEAIFTSDEGNYKISDLIGLLQEAKDRWGDMPVRMSDVGFESSHEDDTIGISQLYLFVRRRNHKPSFCVIESTP